MEEIWKDIPNYEGLYQVSNIGRVKSLKRVIHKSDGTNQTLKGRILSTLLNVGYYQVVLSKDGKLKTFKVHKLVAMAFLGHKPCGYKIVVNHIDFDKKNNKVCNLELVTARENSNRKHLKSSSKYVGVCWDKSTKKWMARIRLNGKNKYLGIFKNELDASNAYQNELNNIINN